MSLFYIHEALCISPQQTFDSIDLNAVRKPLHNKLEVNEPNYKGIPASALRRMGKAIRMGVGAAMPLLAHYTPDGIIIGTANGGMEDCIKFLNQIIEYNEGLLTPGNFVGSTANAIAGQLGLITKNKQYNITHVQSGLSFENALLDAAMLLADGVGAEYLVGGVDEISDYNFNIDWLGGWYKKEEFTSDDFYAGETIGSLAGEGAAMFLVNKKKEKALASVDAMHFFHSTDANHIAEELSSFLQKHTGNEQPDLFLTGENGDSRYLSYYKASEALFDDKTTIARYKHFTGEYPTTMAAAVWLALQFIKQGIAPHFIKRGSVNTKPRKILIYNHYKAAQQSFLLLSLPQ